MFGSGGVSEREQWEVSLRCLVWVTGCVMGSLTREQDEEEVGVRE